LRPPTARNHTLLYKETVMCQTTNNNVQTDNESRARRIDFSRIRVECGECPYCDYSPENGTRFHCGMKPTLLLGKKLKCWAPMSCPLRKQAKKTGRFSYSLQGDWNRKEEVLGNA
jgi:hypothetical protein